MKITINIIFMVYIIIFKSFSQSYYTERNSATIQFMPIYESWSIKNNVAFSEFTSALSLSYFPSSNTNLMLNTNYAATGGDLNSISGFSDTRISVKHNFSKYNLVLTAGVNIPSGKTKLSTDQFETLRFIGQDLFGMRTPNFGQGTNFILGASWVHELSDNYVVGLGLSYQVKSQYQPLKDFIDKYTPSNEISVTGGLDVKISNTQTVTGDIISVFYGSDKINGKEVFSSGYRMIFDLLYKQYFGFNRLSIVLLYSIISEEYYGQSVYADAISSTFEDLKLNPNKFSIGVNYSQRFSSWFSLGYGIQTSFYENTSSFFSNYVLYGITVAPKLKVSSIVNLPVFIRYLIGSSSGKPGLSGFTLGTGITVNL